MRRLIGGIALATLALLSSVATAVAGEGNTSSVSAASDASPAGGAAWPGDAPYSVSKRKMRSALECRNGNKISHHGAGALTGEAREHPVLLVHGTGTSREQNWSWNYWGTLREKGWEVCWVQLPHSSLRDIQVSSEYVAHAIKLMHRASGQKVDVMGHSQGGLQPRWAIKWFSSSRYVADYIGIASPNHGTLVAQTLSSLGGCIPACWQMRPDSEFIAALNRDDETPGHIAYTSIYTAVDELVQPPGTQDLDGASNIMLQDLCPGRPSDHVLIAGDYITWLLVRDALINRGNADPSVVSTEDCARPHMPGAEDPPADFGGLSDFTQDGEIVQEEPPLKPYAQP